MIKYIFSLIAIVTLASAGVVFASWQGAPPNPPNDNVPSVIDISGQGQGKAGDLTVGGMWVREGRVRVGSEPSGGWSSEKLDVNGNIRVRGSSNGVIFSDGSRVNAVPECSSDEPLGWDGSDWVCNSPL